MLAFSFWRESRGPQLDLRPYPSTTLWSCPRDTSGRGAVPSSLNAPRRAGFTTRGNSHGVLASPTIPPLGDLRKSRGIDKKAFGHRRLDNPLIPEARLSGGVPCSEPVHFSSR
jgi:hypothetical protein